MARTKKVSPSPVVSTVHDRIRLAEKALLTGATERVLVSETDLENVASLISDTGQTKAQILKKAVHLGLQVLSMGTAPAPDTTAVVAYAEAPDETLGGWARPEPMPYAGLELLRPAGRHDIPVANEDIVTARNLEDLETQF